jgi:trk system potassium uptake protein TrkH
VTPTLTSLGRILIIITMFAGRVGPLTTMIALAQSAPPKNVIRRVEDRVLIG